MIPRRQHFIGLLVLGLLVSGARLVTAESTVTPFVNEALAAAQALDAGKRLHVLAGKLAEPGDQAVAQLRSLTEAPNPMAPATAAELLWLVAQRGKLTNTMAALASELLTHEDRFVGGLAEWAITIKVQRDNGGQDICWPRKNAPDWYNRWINLDSQYLLDTDYARLAIVWDVHRNGKRLLSSVGSIIRRAEGAASEIESQGSAEDRALATRQLRKLEAIRERLAEQLETHPEDVPGHRRRWLDARHAARPIVMRNPAINFDRIVFVQRHAAHSHRNITGSQYPWIHKPGGDIYVKTGLTPSGAARAVVNGQLGAGHVHGMDLSWDADRLVFGWASQPNWPPPWDTQSGNDVFQLRGEQEPTHIYEIAIDGSGLRQVTNHPYWSDLEPTYCANGDIVFASDRSARSSECGKFSADHTVINIYSVSPDGTKLRRLSDNKDIDRYPHSLDNGLIGYTRWEYQERHFFEVHAFWGIRPDGTLADALFKQHIPAPYGLRDTRSIPGSNKYVSIATGHHTFAYGPVVIVDPSAGINANGAVHSVTPHSTPQEGPPPGPAVVEGGVPDKGGLYQTPWALSDRCFLVSYSPARPPSGTSGGDNASGFSLYLIDAWGNKELVHRDLIHSSSFPIPLRARKRPPAMAPASLPADTPAKGYVLDVYRGMGDIPRGTIKYLRICQRVGWPLDDKIGAQRYIPGNAWEKKFGFWAWAPARVIGTVPVEKDGSAYFEVPADTAVYFQALDENHMEVRRMRSHISFQRGEVRGCSGCHETKSESPPPRGTPLALLHEPVAPEPPSWGSTRLMGYEWLIQPILDQHCIRCHSGDAPDGDLDLAGIPADDGMYRSYHQLFGRRGGTAGARPTLISVSDRFSGAAITQTKEFGSHRSGLVQVLLKDVLHRDEVRLSETEWISLVTWIDLNAPYYDTFFNRRPSDQGEPRRDVLAEWPDPFAAVPSGDLESD